MGGDICAICCGTEREQTVHCPLDCEYLQEARKHEQPPVADPDEFPNKDIRVTEQFLRDHEPLLLFLSVHLLQAAMEIPDVVDSDVKDALDGLVKTFRTLQSGLYYSSRPENPIAAAVYDRMQTSVEELRKLTTERMQAVRDVDILGIFAFLQRVEIQNRNGRRLGRSFIDFLRIHFPPTTKAPDAAPQLIV